ncbi:MAG TPA: carboxymuconolactone decarboxylase family protein [Rubrivivax sp.]|nr:carboxymuconolactone decarboxylase family protein [Rubrivivax sp.]
MEQRLDYKTASPAGFQGMLQLQLAVNKSGLEESLLEPLICDARAMGESEQRLYLLPVWRDAHCYTPRERAALGWTEAVTKIADVHDVPDSVYAEARKHFDEKALVDLTMAIIAINGWNRLNVAFRTTVGDYVSPHRSSK